MAVKILFVDRPGSVATAATAESEGSQCESLSIATSRDAEEALARARWDVVICSGRIDPTTRGEIETLADRHHTPLVVVASENPTRAAARPLPPSSGHHGDAARPPAESSGPAGSENLEQSLRKAEQRYRQTFENAPIGIATADLGGYFVDVNSRFCAILGYPSEEIIGRRFSDFIHPEDTDSAEEVLLQLRAGKLERAHYDRRYLRKGGGDVWARITLTAIRDELEATVYFVGLVEDITEARRAQYELQRRSLQQSALANLGQIALSGSSVEFILGQAVPLLDAVLEADLIDVIRQNGDAFEVVTDSLDSPPGEEHPPEPDGQASMAASLMYPVVALDIRNDERFTPAPRLLRQSIVSSVSAPILSGDGSAWGVLGIHSRTARTFPPHDIEFLRSVVAVLGQAIDRSSADADVRTRVRRQSAIATLGRLALSAADDSLFANACEIVRFAVAADLVWAGELIDRRTLRIRARSPEEKESPNRIAVNAASQAGQAVLSRNPVVVHDYEETNYSGEAANGSRSGVVVPLVARSRTLGVISACSKTPHHFGPEEVDFVQTVANMLAEAVDRDHARMVIRQSEARYRRIFDGASEIIFSVDAAGVFTTLNRAFESITGWSKSDWTGRRFLDTLLPDERPRAEALLRQIVEHHTTVSTQLTLDAPDRRIIVDLTLFPNVEEGFVVEIYGFARDITDAKRAALERERVTRSLKLLLESTLEGIFTLDLDGRCTMINRAGASFLGRSREELIGQRFHHLVHSRTVHGTSIAFERCPITEVLRTGEPRTVASDHFERADGVLMPVAYSAAPIVDDGGRVGAVITFTDLTERRKLESRLEQATRLSSLGRLAATIAHEFNNVLMGIAPFVEVIRRAPSPQKVSSALDHIMASVRRGRGITQEILRFTHPAEPSRSVLDVRSWIDAVAAEASSLLPPNIRFQAEAESLFIEADSNQLRQIFTNLILNARDAMPDGGTISLAVTREPADAVFPFGAVEDASRHAHFAFRDTGSGMDEETLAHAFEPLFTTKRQGTGLGLAVTHQVVHQHGGEIFVESSRGEGTTFHIFLPLAARENGSSADPADDPASIEATYTILLVEDDTAVATGLKALLEIQGFTVTHAEGGAQAIKLARQELPDVVVLDMELPDMNGPSVFAALRRFAPSVPVIFSTGRADRSLLDRLLANPNVGYLAKPYDATVLLEKLEEMLRR